MRRHRTVRAATGTALALLLTAGCTGDSGDGDPLASGSATGSTPVLSAPAESPTPSPSISVPAGLSAEESEAVEKAIEAHRRWVVAVDAVSQSGGTDLEPLEEIAAQAALIYGQQEAAFYVERSWHTVGMATIERVGVKSVSLRTDPETRTVPEVILVSCVNATSVDVVDAAGDSVVTDPRRVYGYTTWVRFYPQSEYPQVGAGVDGWVVGQYENKEIKTC